MKKDLFVLIKSSYPGTDSESQLCVCLLLLALLLAACGGSSLPAASTVAPMQNTKPAPTPSITASLTPSPYPPTSTARIALSSPLPPSPQPSLTAALLPANVDRLPDPDLYTWQVIAEGFIEPIGIVNAMDGSGRLFVVEKQGQIKTLLNGKALPQPFLDLRGRVSTRGATTRGLLGLAFHPDFARNGRFFVHYTDGRGDSLIASYRASPDHNFGDPTTETILLRVSPPVGEHNGGDLTFGPDGYLYIALGDGGGPGYGDQDGNAQNSESFLGKLLRLDVDGSAPYQIPRDNPFVEGGGRPEIWAYGLRNPWRFTFDSLTGDLYIADVGENKWEEINILPSGSPGGANFGWNYREGRHHFRDMPDSSLVFVDPLVEYDHSQGCSVTGGRVYRGQLLPEFYGVYLYGDYCQGNVWGLLLQPDGSWQNRLLFKIQAFITSFGHDEAGEIYLADVTGKLLKLVEK